MSSMPRIVYGAGDDEVMIPTEELVATETRWPVWGRGKDEHVRRHLHTTRTRYHLELAAAIESGAILAADPGLYWRLVRLREVRRSNTEARRALRRAA